MVPPAPAEDDDAEEDLERESRSRSPGRRRIFRERRPGRDTEEPVRRWEGSDDAEEGWDDAVDDDRPKGRRAKPPIFWRARDSLYFEPLVALAILALLLVSLFAYTSNWPPVYVVESNSMQHGSGDHLGVLNAGDIVLAQKVGSGSIVTYVDGLRTGFSTYGLLGDVLLYYPNGSTSGTPIIHRAILYLGYDTVNDTFNATSLQGLSCGSASSDVYYAAGTSGNCSTTYLKAGDILTLHDVGGRTVTVNFAEAAAGLGYHSGYLTLGDNNSYCDQLPPVGDPIVLSTLVKPGWVIGVARGLIPWFGAMKLLLDGNSGKVPTASWEFLGLTLAGVIFAAAGLHFLSKRRREEASLDRDRSDDEETEEPARRRKPVPSAPRSRPAVRPWRATEGSSEGEEAPPPRRMSYEQRRRSHFVTIRERRLDPSRRSKPETSDDEDRSGRGS